MGQYIGTESGTFAPSVKPPMRLMTRAAVALLAVPAILAVGVLALGGWQLVRVAAGPRLPASAATDDAQYFRDTVLANERSGSEDQRKAFDALSREIVARRPSLDDEALSLEVARGLTVFDNAHTRTLLGYKPKSLDEGLRITVDWLREHKLMV